MESLDAERAFGFPSHFNDLCDVLGVEKPTDVDPKG